MVGFVLSNNLSAVSRQAANLAGYRDQELRFTVHDSPDYFQLKVSVFNDDKKTELIGESWIDLRDIIITGGGQSDLWHQLNCRGKYAGEVRIEITFYDTRPKPEKLAVKAKPPVAAEPEPVLASTTTTAGPRGMPKRRPLPSDPVTGKAPPSPTPEAVETPPRSQPSLPLSHMQSHSPLQQPDYHTPPPPASVPALGSGGRYQEPVDHYSIQAPSGEFGTPNRRPDFSGQQYRTPDRQDQYQPHPDDRHYSPHYQQSNNDRYDPKSQEQHDFPQLDHPRARSFEEDRPPPPPAHRTRTGSNPTMNASYQTGAGTAMRHDVLRNEAHRQSATASYPGRPMYKAYDSAPAGPLGSPYSNPDQPSPPRHYSYDSSYDSSYRPMQATVEDVPESPSSLNKSWNRRDLPPQSRSQPQLDLEYDIVASPAPLNLAGRGNLSAGRYSNGPGSTGPSPHRRHDSNSYMPSPPPPQREVSGHSASRHYGRHSESSLVSYGAQPDQKALPYRSELDDTSGVYGMPLVPASLVPGMDPSLAQEIADRIRQDRDQQRRYTQPQAVDTPPRGRAMSEIPRSRYDQEPPPGNYNSGPPSHGRGQITYTGGPSNSSVNVVIKQRNYSPNPPRDLSPNPNPRQTIRRKSVSPAPPPPPGEPRRLSGVPFGPDSYDTFNPAASTAAIRDPATTRPDYDEATGKIITHDGREVDPSDHLPMESWAPEPEPKIPIPPGSSDNSSRPSPSGAQPLPSSGRRPLRLTGRPQSMLPGSGIQYSSDRNPIEPATPSPPASTGRNRLQKKQRASIASGPVMSGANGFGRSGGSDLGSSPLAPLPSHQDNFTPPRQLSRASTYDYVGSNENHAPVLYRGNGHSPTPNINRGQVAPAIPAKIPLALPPPPGRSMTGALQLHSSSLTRRGNLDDWDAYENSPGGRERDVWAGNGPSTLEEELSRIDIGSGRSRRHAGGY